MRESAVQARIWFNGSLWHWEMRDRSLSTTIFAQGTAFDEDDAKQCVAAVATKLREADAAQNRRYATPWATV